MQRSATRAGRLHGWLVEAPAAALAVGVALACQGGAPAAPQPRPPAVLDAWLPEGRLHQALAALADSQPLAEGQDVRVAELGRDAHTSHHLVTLRGAETPHVHERHDLLVVLLRGHGEMRIGAQTRPAGEGSILYVPRGTPHAFRNRAGAPAVAYVVYLPPFDGRDRVERPDAAREERGEGVAAPP